MTDDDITTTSELARLFDVTSKSIADLGKRGVIVRAGRGRWVLHASVAGYCRNLREQAAARGGDNASAARARLGQAQATLAEARARQLSGALIEADAVEKLWTTKLRAFRNRVLAVPSRVKALSARQSASMTTELRAALTELADGGLG